MGTFQDKSSPTLTKKRVGVIGSDSEDDSKENSKVLANKAKGTTTEVPNDEKEKSTEPEEATVDAADGLPPLRKTARNPAFKRKIEESNDDHKKLKEDPAVSEKEESKLEIGGKKLSNKEKQKENKDESPIKKPSPKRKKGVIESDEDSPVKKTPKGRKKKAVIESDEDEETSPAKSKVAESPIKKMVSSVKKQIKKDKEVSDASPVKNPTPKKKKKKKKKKSSAFTPLF